MSIDAMKQALEALKRRAEWSEQDAITNLTAALEAAEKQEPVAWMGEYNINDIRDHYTVVMRHKTDFSSMPDRVRPLYTTPQPAIPAGYALVPVKLPREVETSIWMEGFNDVSDAWECFLRKLAAAPKPENSHD